MTQDEKQLLLKDLCARVPFHPKGRVVNTCNGAECDEWLTCATFSMFTSITNNCRLYLRPMSSMTADEEEQWEEFMVPTSCFDYENNGLKAAVFWDELSNAIDWLNAHHFDYRGLLERGLAIKMDRKDLHKKTIININDYDRRRSKS